MSLLDKFTNDDKQNSDDKHKEDALNFENKCLINECNNGREVLRNDYPEIYDKLATEMGETRFNDDILYNSEIRNLKKHWTRDRNFLDNIHDE